MRIPAAAIVFCLALCAGSLAFGAHPRPPLAEVPFSDDQARQLQRQWAEYLGWPAELTNSAGMKMVLIPPGEFVMGRTEEQFDTLLELYQRDPQLRSQRSGMIIWSMLMMPAHRVRITRPFYMSATEVTIGQFRQFAEASGYKTEAERGLVYGRPCEGTRPLSTWRRPMAWHRPPLELRDDLPVQHLCWNDCAAFCRWLTEQQRREAVAGRPHPRNATYALPTEAQWEYACRAGRATPWNFSGFTDVERLGRQYAIWSDTGQRFTVPQPVAQRRPNAFGLYDMHGNMWEYVADWWHRLYYKESPLNDPAGPAEQSEMHDQRRIIRGGSYDWGRWGADAAYRMRIVQTSNQHPHMGFRVIMTLPGARGVEPAVDPDDQRRRQVRDPGAKAPAVRAVLRGRSRSHPPRLTVPLGRGVSMEFALIPAGSFLMGSTRGAKDERPVHRVVISRPFYMATREVTQAQWEAVMGPHERLTRWRRRQPPLVGPHKPMTDLSWQDCRQFIARLKQKVPDRAFALPTEAQWEYACRAGTQTEFFCGDDPSRLGDYAWYAGNKRWPDEGRQYDFFYDTGTKKPNAFGLYDMHGGVWEWCADWYDADYYLRSPLVDPAGPAAGRWKVLRGGSWFRYARYARSAYRRFFHPEGTGDGFPGLVGDFGCRLVINLGEGGNPAPAKAAPQQSGQLPPEQSGGKPPPSRYVQMARRLARYSQNPVLSVGPQGAWDDQTLGCFSVLDAGDRFFLYTGGTRYGQPKKIGVATSADGIRWTKYEHNPLFPGSMPYAIKVGGMFRLYHPGKDASGRHGLLMRTSRDGFHWSEPRLVLAGGIADPCVVRVAEGRYHLYFCSGGRIQKQGKQVWEFKNFMATSPDGVRWTRRPEPILPLGPSGSWDSLSHAGPVALKLPDGFHLWYLGSGPYKGKTAWRVGHAISPDGVHWARSGREPVLDVGPPGAWDGGTLMSFDIVFRGGKLLFWYAADPGQHGDETKMHIQIGYGTSR